MSPRGHGDAPEATVAVCTFNRAETLTRTLASLRRLRGARRWEVIVVNGPSTDDTEAVLARHDWLTVARTPDRNLSRSRNIALDLAVAPCIAFIDDDAVPEPDWLDLLLGALDADPGLVGVGGFIRDADGVHFQARHVYADEMANEFHCDNEDYATFVGRDRDLFASLTGTNMMFRTEPLRRIGGFDETYAYFLDETDVNRRLCDAGFRQAVIPAAEVHHKYAPSHLRTKTKVATDMYPIARSLAYFCMRHGLPRRGWEAVGERLGDFYRREHVWKIEMLNAGSIDLAQFEALMAQLRRGLLDGIREGVEAPAPAARAGAPRRGAPIVLRGRPADDILRLCMFSQDHAHAKVGGIGKWTGLVAAGLAERGHEVTVIGEVAEPGHREHVDFTDRDFWSHAVGRFEAERERELDCLGLPPTLANRSKRRHAELLRVMPRRAFQVASSPIWDVEGAATLASGVAPTVLSLHTCAGLMLESKPEWRENDAYYRNHVLKVINAELQALRRAPLILANSQAILRDISGVYDLDVSLRPHVVVPHGVADIDAPQGLIEMRAARRAAAAEGPDGAMRILFLGRLETRKGVKPMTEAMAAIFAAGHDVHLDVVGAPVEAASTALVDDLARRFPGRVARHGFLDDARLDALMRQAEVFFAPSLYESFGLIYAEAMRYSVPSVAFAVGGVPEVIADGEDGLLAPRGDVGALHAALERLILDDDLRRKLSRGARLGYEAKFTSALMVERLERIYRGVAFE